MGMPIAVQPARIVGEVAVFDTDRSLTGQDGVGYPDPTSAAESDIAPARLAQRLFAADKTVTNVFVASSQVVVRRGGGWDTVASDAAGAIIAGFFVHYS